MAVCMVIGAVDLIIGDKFGVGGAFKKGFLLFGELALSMIGMIVLSPVIADLINPLLITVSEFTQIDPSLAISSIFANDMGGASVSAAVAINKQIGSFNGLIVASMMGCTVSFTVPYALGVVKKAYHGDLILGLLCGIITIPVGCLVSGIILRCSFLTLLTDIIPLTLFSLMIAFFLYKFPGKTVKVFYVIGNLLQSFIYIGLAVGTLEALTGFSLINGTNPIGDGVTVVSNAVFIMAGALPLLYILSCLLKKPLKSIGRRFGMNETSALCMIGTLATSTTTFAKFSEMDQKGRILNAAFAVSAAFVLADHLAFTIAFNGTYTLPMIAGKTISGLTALIVANLFSKTVKYQTKGE